MNRQSFTTTATQKRLSAYSSDKATYASVSGVTLYGYFAPTSPYESSAGVNMLDQSYQFVVDGPTDVKQNDQLTISSTVYGVRGIQRFTNLSQDILVCTLTKVVKD